MATKAPLELLLTLKSGRIAGTWSNVLQHRWNGSGLPLNPSTQDRYDNVINVLREGLLCLIPKHEDKARSIFSLIHWPTKNPSGSIKTDFSPIPTFEALFGGTCPTCKGTGISGTIFSIRCPDC